MNKSLAVFRRDLKRILRNPVALVVAVGICVVPCLYAWINILANWDPYANTGDVPVAVVDLDQPVTTDSMGEVCAGEMIEEALKENDAIGWVFLDDEDAAVQSVKAGTNYAAIVIPEDFTKRLTGVLDGDRTKASLTYYVNEKVNAVAPKVTDTGASTIETQIDEHFMAVVSEVAVKRLEGVAGNLIDDSREAVADSATTLSDVQKTLGTVDGELGDLSDSLQAAHDALDAAAADMTSLNGMGGDAARSMNDALDDVDDTRSRVSALAGQLDSALGEGTDAVSSLSSQATYDVSALAGEISYAQRQVEAAIGTLEQDLTDTRALASEVEDARQLTLSITPAGFDTAALTTSIERDLDDELDLLLQLQDAQAAKLDELRDLASRVATEADGVAKLSQTLNADLKGAGTALGNARATLSGAALADIGSALDTFVRAGQQLSGALELVDPLVTQTVEVAHQLADTLATTQSAVERTQTGMAGLAGDVRDLSSELGAIQASETWELLKEIVDVDPQSVHEFMNAPVELVEKRLFPVDNYGSGVAPFFTSVALWVGGIALVAIYKLEVDEDEVGTLRPWQAYLGRWLLFVLLGMLQAIICCTGNLVIGIQCAHPWALYLSAIVASFAFVNIIFALSVAFKHIGKALAFTLIILQVPGSSGMYPIEMMPTFFQRICPWLPFTYSNNALREAIGGLYDGNLARDLGLLLLFVVPSLLVGITARGHLVNVNALFDRRLRETDHLLVSEPVAIEGDRHRLATVVKAIEAPDEYREELEVRSAAFERVYPHLVRYGILTLFAVPAALFALMLITDVKLPLLACWIVALVVIYTALIIIEYFHDRIGRKHDLADLSAEEKDAVLRKTLREELLPLAPIDALIERRDSRARGGDER